MRKNFGAKHIVYPQPVFIIGSYDETGTPNAMTAAWGGISDDTELSICVGERHKTVGNILDRGAFTVSMGVKDQVVACDYFGLVSGNTEPNQVEKAGFHARKAEHVDAPIFDELPLAVECKLVSYDAGTGRLVGEIVNVCAEERILNENGMVDPAKLQPLTYDTMNKAYWILGEKVGDAYHDGLQLK